MKFITPDDIRDSVNYEAIAMDINMLSNGNVKLQTIHNHTSIAMINCELESYITKVLAKAYFKFLTRHEGA
jgi:hypothetical protein